VTHHFACFGEKYACAGTQFFAGLTQKSAANTGTQNFAASLKVLAHGQFLRDNHKISGKHWDTPFTVRF
jgi:hypothetical protein